MSRLGFRRDAAIRVASIVSTTIAVLGLVTACGFDTDTAVFQAAMTAGGSVEIGQCSLAPVEPQDPRAPDAYSVGLSLLDPASVDPGVSGAAVSIGPPELPVHPRLLEVLQTLHDVPAEMARRNSHGDADGVYLIDEAPYVSGRSITIDLLLSDAGGTAFETCSMTDTPHAGVSVAAGDGEAGCDVYVRPGEPVTFSGRGWPSPDDLGGYSDGVPLPNSNILFALIRDDFDVPLSDTFFADCEAAGECFLGGFPAIDESSYNHPGPIFVAGGSGGGAWSVSWTPAAFSDLPPGRYLAFFFTASTMNDALDATGHRLFHPCAIEIEQPAAACGAMRIEAYRHHVGKRAYKEPLDGAAVAVIDKSGSACWRGACGDSVPPNVYDCIINEVFQTGHCPGDVAALGVIGGDSESGAKVFQLPAGDYVVLAQGLKTSTGRPMGVSASDCQCAPGNDPAVITMHKHLEETVR